MPQNAPPEDLRVRRTRKLILNAFVELVIEKGFAAVTVNDIAERAMVNRATFYRHYADKYELLKRYMDELYELTAMQAPLPHNRKKVPDAQDPPTGMVHMLQRVQAHADFFRVMLGTQGDPEFTQRIREYSENRLRSLLPDRKRKMKRPGEPPLDLCLSYLAAAGVGGIIWWLNQKQPIPPEQMAQWLSQLANATFERVTT